MSSMSCQSVEQLGKRTHIDILTLKSSYHYHITYHIVIFHSVSLLFLQDGEIMNAANAIDDDEVDNAWKTMQQQTAVKGHTWADYSQ